FQKVKKFQNSVIFFFVSKIYQTKTNVYLQSEEFWKMYSLLKCFIGILLCLSICEAEQTQASCDEVGAYYCDNVKACFSKPPPFEPSSAVDAKNTCEQLSQGM
ncbi:hypothetical protein Anas_09308, partial [Armadillidium nasatum]